MEFCDNFVNLSILFIEIWTYFLISCHLKGNKIADNILKIPRKIP